MVHCVYKNLGRAKKCIFSGYAIYLMDNVDMLHLYISHDISLNSMIKISFVEKSYIRPPNAGLLEGLP